MTPDVEKKQWSICVFCGSQCVVDPAVLSSLMSKGRTREEAEKYAVSSVYLICPRRAEHLKDLSAVPLVPLDQLEHGAYYHGKCRNATVARWDANKQKFTYMREKFRQVFPEDIGYWIEATPGQRRFDEFKPYGKMDNPPFEIPLEDSSV